MSKHSIVRWIKIIGAYLLVAAVAALGWLWCALPEQVYLEPEQPLMLPRFGWVEPLRGHGSRNVASTRAAGSYQTTLALGGWLPVKIIRATVMQRPTVTVCGTPFGVKMFSEGALVVGFSEVHTAAGTVNPAKQAGLRLGDRVIRMGNTVTETNEQVHAALEAAAGAAVEVVYVRKGEQRQTTLLPVWDTQNAQWRAGMWVRDSSAGVGTLTFVDAQAGVFAGLGHPISDSDTGEQVALRSGEIVACQIVGCTGGTAGSPGELKGKFISDHALGRICINGENGVYGTVSTAIAGQQTELAFAQEVLPGAAEILTTTNGETPRSYRVYALFVLQYSSGLIFVGFSTNRILKLLRVELHVSHSLDFCTLQVADGSHTLRFTEHDGRIICKRILDKCEFGQQFRAFGSLKKYQKVVQLSIDFC